MTLSEYELLEKDFQTSSTDIRTFLRRKGVSPHKYYYWKRKSRELKESSSISDGEFLPIDLHTPSGAEFRIRGIMDSLMLSTIIASTGGRRNV